MYADSDAEHPLRSDRIDHKSCVLLFYGGPVGIYESTEDNILGLLIAVTAVVYFFISIPCIVGGIFLRQLQEWSRGTMIVTSALNIMNVPVGSIIGAYGLWAS